eukprot:COSAG02_NODE_56334_length_286_cov_0.609626_1_plen_45_part_10
MQWQCVYFVPGCDGTYANLEAVCLPEDRSIGQLRRDGLLAYAAAA